MHRKCISSNRNSFKNCSSPTWQLTELSCDIPRNLRSIEYEKNVRSHLFCFRLALATQQTIPNMIWTNRIEENETWREREKEICQKNSKVISWVLKIIEMGRRKRNKMDVAIRCWFFVEVWKLKRNRKLNKIVLTKETPPTVFPYKTSRDMSWRKTVASLYPRHAAACLMG